MFVRPAVRKNRVNKELLVRKIITFGTFDLLHVGHLSILERAKSLGDYLIVGVSTDKLNAGKGKYSVFSQAQRLAYVQALGCVDEAFLEESLEEKDDYIKAYGADLLVMGDDWIGKFDWVSCETRYMVRTPEISSTQIKTEISENNRMKIVLFGDTYIKKHYDCAISIVNELTEVNIAPIFSSTRQLPPGIECDCIVYFNMPAKQPPEFYDHKPRVLIDHGASTLKWFLANRKRYSYFDSIITAGPDHVKALTSFFPGDSRDSFRVKSGGFIKSGDLLSAPNLSRDQICHDAGLNADKPIVLFAPTWHINANTDMTRAIEAIATIDNQVSCLHPETAHLDVSALNVVENVNGMTVELLKHADIVISDTSSTLYEAAALGKKTVQIVMREYSDNNSVLFDFPYVAGTSDLFCGGIIARPDEVVDVVDRLLHNNSALDSALSSLHERVLQGTLIQKSAGKNIVAELLSACSSGRQPCLENVDRLAKEGLKVVHENMFYSKNRIIAHGGGDYQALHASNSQEAIHAAADAVDFIEVDIVKGKDGLLVAHDTFENRFNLDIPFSETSVDKFLSCKYQEIATPTSIESVLEYCRSRGKVIICDIKSSKEEYKEVVNALYTLCEEMNIKDRLVIQCYCPADFEYVISQGFRRTLLAVWKCYYKDPLGPDAFQFVTDCMAVNPGSVIGVSMPYINKHMPTVSYKDAGFNKWFSFWKRMYIHGAPKNAYSEILRKNLGVFADAFSAKNEFRDYPQKFDWRHYLFLNPGLVDAGVDNQIAATNHYIDYGLGESRNALYQIPSDFQWFKYVDKNPMLRKNGVSGVDSAKAHWTNYGHSENRQY